MRRLLSLACGVGLASLMGLTLASAAPIALDKTESGCGSHGTRVEFVDSPREAAKLAKKEQKLVFVLHVSGNFEDPRFT